MTPMLWFAVGWLVLLVLIGFASQAVIRAAWVCIIGLMLAVTAVSLLTPTWFY